MTATESMPRSSFSRLPAAIGLQFLVPSSLVLVPVLVFFSAWAIAAGVGWLVHSQGGIDGGQPMYTGASQATLWCLVFMAAYAASHTFPFAMALSYSRRIFTLGTVLAFCIVSLLFGAAVAAAAAIEQATDGLGVDSYTFALPFLVDGPGGVFGAGLVSALLCLALMIAGFAIVILYRRFGLMKLWIGILGLVVILAGVAGLMTVNEAWGDTWRWLTEQTVLTFSGYLAAASLVLTAVTYATIRKTTPA